MTPTRNGSLRRLSLVNRVHRFLPVHLDHQVGHVRVAAQFVTAIDGEALPRYPGRIRTCQETYRLGDVLRFAAAFAQRRLFGIAVPDPMRPTRR